MASIPPSCVVCRRRKVRCDRLDPCSNCSRAKIECSLPSPRRLTQSRVDHQRSQLLARIQQLEDAVLGGLGPQIASSSALPPAPGDMQVNGSVSASAPAPTISMATDTAIVDDTGRVDLQNGGSLYHSSSSWTSMLAKTSVPGPCSSQSITCSDTEAWSTPISPRLAAAVRAFHPPPAVRSLYWHIFTSRVDPLLKVLHAPSFEAEFVYHTEHLDSASTAIQGLLFAIYYAAVTSVTGQECFHFFGEERSVLISKYTSALQKIFAAANLLATDDVRMLRALVIFLFCQPRQGLSRSDSTLAAMSLCIAQSIGIHRDGNKLGLSPFESEMRRRLWWQVRLLNIRASVELGKDPVATRDGFDNTFPLNVNDGALSPDLAQLPTSNNGFTDMTFCLVRIEVHSTFERHISTVLLEDQDSQNSLPPFDDWRSNVAGQIEGKYLRHGNPGTSFFKFTNIAAHLILGKFALILDCRLQRAAQTGSSGHTLYDDKLFTTAVETIERANELNTDTHVSPWSWFCRSYTQCHAAAYVLSILDHDPDDASKPPLYDNQINRAWNALTMHMDHQSADDSPRNAQLLQPLLDAYSRCKMSHSGASSSPSIPQSCGSPILADFWAPFDDGVHSDAMVFGGTEPIFGL